MTTGDRPPPRPPPRWARRFTLIAGALAIALLAFTIHQVGPATLARELGAIGWWFTALIAIEIVAALCDALAISGFLGPAPPRSSFRRVLQAQVIGRAINLVTPLASVGEATKATLLMRDTASSRAAAAIGRFGLAYVIINLGLVTIGAPICAATLDLPAWLTRTLWVGTGLAIVLVIGATAWVQAGLLASAVGALARLRLISPERAAGWRDRGARFDEELRGGGGLRGWWPALFAAISKLLQWLAAWIVLYANGAAPPLDVMAALATAGTVVNIVANIVPLGLGVAEGGTAALMAALGQPASLGVTIALARRAVHLVYAGFGLTLLVTLEAAPWRKRT